MKIAVMQPYLFPYLGYFQLIRAVDLFVMLDDVNYINRGWINRNRILSDKGNELITLKLSRASQNKFINQIEVLPEPDNRSDVTGKIERAYAKAPQFSTVMPILRSIISNPEEQLSVYIEACLKTICTYLKIETPFLISSSIPKDSALKGQEKIAAIVKSVGGNMYINLIGGMQLYDGKWFRDEGIELRFIEMKDVRYRQFGNLFQASLSIIDVIMFNDQDGVASLLTEYRLR
jgi:WbqC-like protein family